MSDEPDETADAGEDEAELGRQRERMVENTIAARGVYDPRVLAAMRKVPRHLFVPEAERSSAYADTALPIGHEVTISQPYVVAEMTALAQIEPGDRVLEVGTGSGYQAAVLAEIGAEVYTIERIAALVERARTVLSAVGYGDRVHTKFGDGFWGWPEHAPYAAILLTAAPPRVPRELIMQLEIGGRMVAPIGGAYVQSLQVIERTSEGSTAREISSVMFVPMLPGTREE